MLERELFARTYADVKPDDLWVALKRALATWDLRAVDEDERSARFSTGVSLTSWGQHLFATVSDSDGGSVLSVRGRPKGTLLSTKTGEDRHARKVEKELVDSLDRVLTGVA